MSKISGLYETRWCDAMSNIDYLPIWKKDGTASDRLYELAAMAVKHPERFERFVLCHVELLPGDRSHYRRFSHNTDLAQSVGIHTIAIHEILKASAA